MKKISLMRCFSLMSITMNGSAQATDVSIASVSGIMPPPHQTLIVVFGSRQGVFDPALAAPGYTAPVAAHSAPEPSNMHPDHQVSVPSQPALATPEPTTLILVGLGVIGLIGIGRRIRKGWRS